jgi:hypothetical protein
MPDCPYSLFLEVVIAVVWLSVFLMTSKPKKVPKAPFEQGTNPQKATLKKAQIGVCSGCSRLQKGYKAGGSTASNSRARY